MKRQTISLCMIVKNEAHMIEKCLESVKNIVDEMIIVDTGSTDQTIVICEQYNCDIYHYKWNDHFADARNYSISKATKDWILYLDADEVLQQNSHAIIEKTLTHSQANRFLLQMINYVDDTFQVDSNHYFTYHQPRLFKNKIGYQFQNRIHETLYLNNEDIEIVDEQMPLKVYHYGYIKDVTQKRKKSERNKKLLQLAITDAHPNPWNKYHLASEYYRLQDYERAFEYINDVIYEFVLLNLKPPALLYRLKYAILIETNSIEGAWPGINKAIQLYPDYVDLVFYKGYILYHLKRYEEAKKVFKQCLQLDEQHVDYLILKGVGSFMAERYIEKCAKKLKTDNKQPNKRILYIGWLGFRNLGDELMYDLFKEKVNAMDGHYSIDFVNYAEQYMRNVNVKQFDLVVLGGGSIFSGLTHPVEPYIIQFLYDAIQANKKVMIWGTGIDSLPYDAIYPLQNKRTYDLNMKHNFIEKVQFVFKNAAWTGVRGPLTYQLFQNVGVNDELLNSGDPAFLMELNQENQKKKERIIGVNWGTAFDSLYGGNEMQIEEQLVDTLTDFIKQHYKIYLYVLWDQDIPAAKRVYDKLNNADMVTLDTTLYKYNELLPIINTFQFTINFKMHANYISLAANTPFIAFGYRFKVYDFVQSIGMERLLVRTDSVTLKDDIFERMAYIKENEQFIVTQMESMQQYYQNMLNEPFEKQLFLH